MLFQYDMIYNIHLQPKHLSQLFRGYITSAFPPSALKKRSCSENMIRSKTAENLVLRNGNVRQLRCKRGWTISANFFHVCDISVASPSSPMTCFKRSKNNQRLFAFNTLGNLNIQRYSQRLLRRKLSPPERIQIPQYHGSYRLFTTGTKETRKSGRPTRKKKRLLPSGKKITTKDRLRLSSRPSKNNRQHQNSADIEGMMIKSPEELMERLNSGLDIARTAVREGYISLRNPTDVGNKHGNHLLSARPAPSGISEGPRPIPAEGLVMDANWWFWNLLFAASPSLLIALYCQFIVKPEMKIRYNEREKDEASEGNENINGSDDGIGDNERRSNIENKISPMRMRQEEQKHKDEKLSDDITTSRNSSSSPPLTTTNDLNEVLSSYCQLLVSWISGQQSPPTPVSEHGSSRENGTEEAEKRSTKINPNESQTKQKNEIISLEIQQQKLKELQSQLELLQDKIDRQQQQRASSNVSNDLSENSAKRGSLLLSIGKLLRGTTAAGIAVGRERWGSFFFWLRSGGPQSSDESSNSRGVDTGDGGIIPRRNVSGGAGGRGKVFVDDGKENVEKIDNIVRRAPTE